MTEFRKLAVCWLLVGLSAGIASAQDRIRGPLDRNRTAALKGHVHPLAAADADQGPVDPDMPLRNASLLFKPSASIDTFLTEQQTPSSPNYHKWLTPEEFGDRFGLSNNDIAKVTAWLESQGLKVDKVARGRHWINFSGTAAQAERTFRTRFHRFTVNGEMHFANVDAPQVPAELEDLVGGFLGLDDFKLKSLALRPQATSSKGTHSLVPDDLAAIYNIAPLHAAGFDGTGQKIAIIGDSSLDLADIRGFRQYFNLPASDPQQILVGDDPGYNDDVVESNLDIEWAGAVARGAKILYVYGQSVYNATQFAIDENLAPVLSLSFGGCEAYNRPALRAVAQQASAQGITWLASSGDTGAAECDRYSNIPQASKGLNIGFPASIPEVTSVGGTQLDDTTAKYWAAKNTANGASALGYIPEAVWNDTEFTNGFSGSGGGLSILFPKPWWQSGPGVPAGAMRASPDISLAASPRHAPYQLVVYGALYTVGGTSASAPALAGVMAIANQYLTAKGTIAKPGLGNINPTLYRMARGANNIFHDITDGDNALRCALGTPDCVEGFVGHKAGPGYDLATGLGTVDANNLVTQWSNGAASSVSVVADPPAASLKDTLRLTATVRGASAGASPTGSITFLGLNVVENALGSSELVAGVASITVPAAAVIGGEGKVTALYNGDATYGASSGSVMVGVVKPAAGSMVVVHITPDPVYRQTPLQSWPYSIVISEKAGVQTTLTAFTVNGVNNLGAFGGSASVTVVLPAKGTLSADLAGNNLTVPLDRVFHFEGKDADGTTWSRDLTIPFLESTTGGATNRWSVSSAPSTVRQNPKADASCQFSHRLVIQETGGFLMQLTVLKQGTTDLSASIQQIFGTTHLAPFGTLQGDLCFSGTTSLGAKLYTVTGLNYELGNTMTTTFNVTLAAASSAPSTMSVSPAVMNLAVNDSNRSAATEVALNFGGDGTAWTATVLSGSKWLTLAQTEGTSAGAVKVIVNSAGLSHGAHRGLLLFQASDAVPQAIVVPVNFVVGTSDTTVITAIANGASFSQSFAPGMLLSVFGTQLAGVTKSATTLPLPLELGGVSATVNGVSAPIYYVSPGQVNVQIPYETGAGPAVLGVNNGGQVSNFPFTVAAAAPGVFTAADGSLAPSGTVRLGASAVAYITGDGDTSNFLITGSSPATGTASSRLPRPRLAVTVTIGGVNAAVSFAGTPIGMAGVSQVNFTMPANTPLGVQPVIITVGGVRSQAARLTVTP